MTLNDELLSTYPMIYNLAFQMLNNKEMTEDITQSIIEKIIEKYPSFKKDSKFSTWAYRIAYNSIIDFIRNQKNEKISFELFKMDVENFIPYKNEFGLNRQEEIKFTEEVKIGCTLAMLQCLKPNDRFLYILSNIFNFKSNEISLIVNIKAETIRKSISRSKIKISEFMMNYCGLTNEDSFCTCNKRLLIASERGRINIEKLRYNTSSVKIREMTDEMNEIDSISKIFQSNPFYSEIEFLLELKNKYGILNYNLVKK